MSIAVAVCFHNEIDSIGGLIENAQGFFDELIFADCGRDGKPSDDGSLDVLRKWGISPLQWNINDGFGVVRTNLIRQSKCEFVMLQDCDERFFPYAPLLQCDGDEKYPEHPNPNLNVRVVGPSYSQGALLRSMIASAEGFDAIVCRRRHWQDFTWKHPSQNFDVHPDWQCRIVRNTPNVGFDPNVRMHERIVNFNTGGEPNMIRQTMNPRAVFFDHFHVPFKRMNIEKNRQDMQTYQQLDKKGTEGMWLNASI